MGKLTHTVSGNPVSFKSADKSNIESLKVYFDPMQIGTGDTSPSNIKSISGWTSINYFQTSEAIPIIPINFTPIELNGGTLNYLDKSTFFISGTLTSNTIFSIPIKSFTLKKNKTYNKVIIIEAQGAYVSGIPSAGIGFKYNDSSFFSLTLTPVSQPINVWNHSSDWTREDQDVNTFNIILRTGWSNVKVKFLLTENTINESTVQFDQTIYGGYIDLITGTLVQTHAKFIEDGSVNPNTWIRYNASYGAYYQKPLAYLGQLQPKLAYQTCIFNYLKSPLSGKSWEGAIGTNANPNNGTPSSNDLRLIFPKESFSSVNDLLVYLAENPIEVVYQLETPIICQLSSQQLQTLRGQNYIQSNANDKIEVTYEFTDHMAKRRLELNIPHIETISGNIASFNTNMIAPLKECKVNFFPFQTGEDPSPTNILPIQVHNSINLIQNKKSIVPFLAESKFSETRFQTYSGWCDPWKIPDRTKKYIYSVYFDNTNGARDARAIIWYRNKDNTTFVDTSTTISESISVGSTGRVSILIDPEENPNTYYIQLGLSMENATASNPMVEIETTNTNYEPYYSSNHLINWSNEYPNIYGGYIDLVNNKIANQFLSRIVPYGNNAATITSTDSGLSVIAYNIGSVFGSIDAIDSNGLMISNMFKKIIPVGTMKNITTPWTFFTTSRYIVFVGDTTLTTKEDWTNLMIQTHNVHVVAQASTPVLHDLTLPTIKTLKGINNIQSNINDPIEIKYWTH